MIIESLEILSNTWLSPDVFRITLTGQDIPARVKPGHFVQLLIEENSRSILRRPFSVFYSDGEHELQILYKVVGSGTRKLSELRPGAVLSCLGPLGHGFSTNGYDKIILVAGGVGIAPLNFLARSIPEPTRKILVFGARNKSFFNGFEELNKIFDELYFVTDDGSFGYEGEIMQHFPDFYSKHEPQMIYACGPELFLEKLVTFVRNEEVQIEVAMERRMACGFGVCMSCICETKQGIKLTCKDGPVFNGRDLFVS